MGNILSKYEVHKIALKQRGGSTFGKDAKYGLTMMFYD